MSTRTIKTSELTGAALDWAVAKCEGAVDLMFDGFTWGFTLNGKTRVMAKGWAPSMVWLPSTDWAQGGPIIEREGISWHCGNKTSWHAYSYGSATNYSGPTPLIAAMRAFVASKLGDEVEVPEELL